MAATTMMDVDLKAFGECQRSGEPEVSKCGGMEAQKCRAEEQAVERNMRAIAFFERGELHEAVNLFSEAAKEWSLAKYGKHIVGFAGGEPKQQTSELPTVLYDEGMDAFPNAEHIPSDSHEDVVAAILLFNSAQASRKLDHADQAFACYQMALDKLLPHIAAETVTRQQAVNVAVTVLHNMGHLQYRRKQNDEAIAFYEFALQESREQAGADQKRNHKASFHVAATLNCLGMVNRDDLKTSVRYLQESLSMMVNLFGRESAWVATVLNNLGRAYVASADGNTALVCFRKALAIRKQCLGSCHVDYGATAFNLAQCLHSLGQLTEALVQYDEFYRLMTLISSTTSSRQHDRDIAVVLSCMGQIHHEQGHVEQASEFYDQSLELGCQQPSCMSAQDLAVLLNRIGNFRFDCGDLNGALEVYKEGLKIEQSVLEENHPNITVTMSNIAEIHRQKGEFAQSIQVYSNAIELLKTRHGAESAQVAAALNVVGLICDQKGDTDTALETLQQALAIRRVALGDEHVDVASTLLYLGTIFCRKQMFTVAMRLLLESYRIRKAQLGPNNLFVSYSAYNVGLCHQMQGNNNEAMKYFIETLQIQKCLLGKRHKDIAATLMQIGDSLHAEGELGEALKYFEEALCIKRETAHSDKDLSGLVKVLTEIGSLCHATGQTERMMQVFTESAPLFRTRGISIHQLYPPLANVELHELRDIGPCAPSA